MLLRLQLLLLLRLQLLLLRLQMLLLRLQLLLLRLQLLLLRLQLLLLRLQLWRVLKITIRFLHSSHPPPLLYHQVTHEIFQLFHQNFLNLMP